MVIDDQRRSELRRKLLAHAKSVLSGSVHDGPVGEADAPDRIKALLTQVETLTRERDEALAVAEGPSTLRELAAWCVAHTFARGEAEAERDALRKILEPFAACVFNDNGDVTISTGSLTASHWLRASRVLREGISNQAEVCGCGHCSAEVAHASDCAVHNEPAMSAASCDCGAEELEHLPATQVRVGKVVSEDRLAELIAAEARALTAEAERDALRTQLATVQRKREHMAAEAMAMRGANKSLRVELNRLQDQISELATALLNPEKTGGGDDR